MSRSRLRNRLLLALGATVLALGAVELGVRIVRPQAPNVTTWQRMQRGKFREPGVHPNVSDEFSVQVHVNSHRWVDQEWRPHDPDIPRVIVLGDSFVEAAQVELEEGFGRVLEEALAAERGGPVHVISMGVPGAGTAHELSVLSDLARGLGAQLIVLGMLVSNDVFNNHPLLDPKEDKIFFRPTEQGMAFTDSRTEWGSSWLVPGLWRVSHAWRLLARTVAERQIARDRLERGGGMPVDLRVHDPAGGPIWEEAWAYTDAALADMARECEAEGADFAVLIFTSQVEATAAGRQAAIEAWPTMEGWDLQVAIDRSVRVAEQHAPTLDLTPALRAADGEPPLYYAQDGHWTPRGHRVAAEEAAPFLAELLED